VSNRPTIKISPFRTGGLGDALAESLEPSGGIVYRFAVPEPSAAASVIPQGWGVGAGRAARPVRVAFEAPDVAQVGPEARNQSR